MVLWMPPRSSGVVLHIWLARREHPPCKVLRFALRDQVVSPHTVVALAKSLAENNIVVMRGHGSTVTGGAELNLARFVPSQASTASRSRVC